MMPLRDMLKKKEKHSKEQSQPQLQPRWNHPQEDEEIKSRPTALPSSPPKPEFVFIRSDTNTREFISPPTFVNDDDPPTAPAVSTVQVKRHSLLRRFSDASSTVSLTSSAAGPAHTSERASGPGAGAGAGAERRLSHLLQFRSRSRTTSVGSIHVPADLPSIADGDVDGADDKEAQWERRATLLAQGNTPGRGSITGSTASRSTGSLREGHPSMRGASDAETSSTGRERRGTVSDPNGDENIQEAIRLHESGDLNRSTAMFGRLADPAGANDGLSQVLYGLALRHGWGCRPDPTQAIYYLTLAAQNSAQVESVALRSGLKRGGAAKGELVLAIYELANCFRHGWGLSKDPLAAKHYYETAANLGDVDAMNEVAWCYETGFGAVKDKAAAAKYFRLAEQNGSRTLGNSWIWKSKYDHP